MEKLNIGGRLIGPREIPYVIAEIGANHNGDMALCRRLVDAAKASGADAAKFQSWSKGSIICKAEYARNTSYADTKRHFGSLEEMVERYQFTAEQHQEIAVYCRDVGIEFLSSAFSPSEVDLLESLDVPLHKIASMDVNNPFLLKHIAQTGKPVILSTGMASLGEVEAALGVLRANGSGPVALLHCIAIYPPDYHDIHLRNIPMLQQVFDVPVGFSDHSMGTAVPLAAVALGACIIEKHFTLDRNMDGWDHSISATPNEMKTIVDEGRNVTLALGSSVRTVSEAELEKRLKFRRSVVTTRTLKAGHCLVMDDFDFKRPGDGIRPDEVPYLLGRSLVQDLDTDEKISWESVS
jgi:N,N'-diacetyllegionaminate synthase